MIKKFFAWIKAKLFRKKEVQRRTDLDQILGQKIKQRQAKMGRLVEPRMVSHNMPRYQPCPVCNRGSKITEKTEARTGEQGAVYKCNKHAAFLVGSTGKRRLHVRSIKPRRR